MRLSFRLTSGGTAETERLMRTAQAYISMRRTMYTHARWCVSCKQPLSRTMRFFQYTSWLTLASSSLAKLYPNHLVNQVEQ